MLKISFDFDDCLNRPFVQEFAKSLILEGHDVWIVTTRLDNAHRTAVFKDNMEGIDNDNLDNELKMILSLNDVVFATAKELGIPENKIIFTNMEWKHVFFEQNPDFHFHFDDYFIEHKLIQKHTKVIPISVEGNSNFINKFNRLKGNV